MDTSFNYPLQATKEVSTKALPFVKFNQLLNKLTLSGHLRPDNMPVTATLLSLIDEHFSRHEELNCIFRVDRMNVQTTKTLFAVFKTLQYHQNMRKKISIFWMCHHENQPIIATGFDLSELFGIDIQMLPV